MTADRQFQEALGSIRHNVSSTLDRLYPSVGLPELPPLAEALEGFAISQAFDAILENAPEICGCHPAADPRSIFDAEGHIYRLDIAPDLPKESLLAISFTGTSVEHPVAKPKQTTVPIEGFGQYRKVRIYHDPHLPLHADQAGALVVAVFETVYAWYKARVQSLAIDERVYLGRALYQALAVYIPSEELRENVWFACVTEDYGYRLLDPLVATRAFGIIDDSDVISGLSTHRLVAEVLSTILPRPKLLMQEAIRAKRCIDVSLVDATYRKEGSVYAVALRALYHSDSISMYPIVADDPLSVIALFPTSVRTQVETVLSDQAPHLKRISRESISRIRRAMLLFTQGAKRISLGGVGEIMAGFLKEMLRS